MAKAERIAVLTSGGDAPGMNAAIRATVRSASIRGIECYGVLNGYEGLIEGSLIKIDSRFVSDIVQKGGTVLRTSRCPEFGESEGRKRAHEVLKAYNIDGLAVIGGGGSLAGLADFWREFRMPCAGIPGTIDNDLAYTDFTLGFDTAVNTVVNAINNIRDTMTAHDRACVIEVMGRTCGDIALYSGIAGGAEIILVPEAKVGLGEIERRIRQDRIKGKNSEIIVIAEGVCGCDELKAKILGVIDDLSIRTVKLGYIQRGGTPTMSDRVLAAMFGARAAELFCADEARGRLIGIRNNRIVDEDIETALRKKRAFDAKLYETAMELGR